jgi:hypothetical protein
MRVSAAVRGSGSTPTIFGPVATSERLILVKPRLFVEHEHGDALGVAVIHRLRLDPQRAEAQVLGWLADFEKDRKSKYLHRTISYSLAIGQRNSPATPGNRAMH